MNPDKLSDPAVYLGRVDGWAKAACQSEHIALDSAPLIAPGVHHKYFEYGATAGILARDVIDQAGLRRPLVVIGQQGDCIAANCHLKLPGLSTAIYPVRSESNCKNFGEVTRAHKIGLSPGMVICPDCPHREECDFLDEEDEAKHADILFMRGSRVQANLLAAMRDRDTLLGFLPGKSCELFAPFKNAFLEKDDDGNYLGAMRYAAEIAWCYAPLYHGDDEEWSADQYFWCEILYIIHQINAAVAKKESVDIPLPDPLRQPPKWARRLWNTFRRGTMPGRDVINILVAAASGVLKSLAFHYMDSDAHVLSAAWRPAVISDRPVLIWDTTTYATELESATGRQCVDISKDLPLPSMTTQKSRVTRNSRASTLVKLVRAFAEEHLDKKVGVLLVAGRCTPDEIRARLPKEIQRRVVIVEPEQVHELDGCDIVAICGAREPSDTMIRRRLQLTGRVEESLGSRGDLAWQEVIFTIVLGNLRQMVAAITVPKVWLWDSGPANDAKTSVQDKEQAIMGALAELLGEKRAEAESVDGNCATDAQPIESIGSARQLRESDGRDDSNCATDAQPILDIGSARQLRESDDSDCATDAQPIQGIGSARQLRESDDSNCATDAQPILEIIDISSARQLRKSSVTAREIANRTGLPIRTVQMLLKKMAARGQVIKIGTTGKHAGWLPPPRPMRQGQFAF